MSSKSKRYEVLIGETRILDYLSQQRDDHEIGEHPWVELVAEAVETLLTDSEVEVFYLRYGENLSIRKIASRLGYNSHRIIQIKLERISKKVKEYVLQQVE